MGDLQRQGWSAWGTRKFCPVATCFGAEKGYYVQNKLHIRVQYLVEKGLLRKETDVPACGESELSKREPSAFPPFYETGLSSLLALESSSNDSMPSITLKRSVERKELDETTGEPILDLYSVELHPAALQLAGFDISEDDTHNSCYETLVAQLQSSPLPTRSIFAFVAVLYGATLKLSDPVSLDDIRMLCHVVRLLQHFEIDCTGLLYDLRHALFYAPFRSINFGKVFETIWCECERSQLLLDVIIPYLRMEQEQFENSCASLDSKLVGHMTTLTRINKAVYGLNYVPRAESPAFKLIGMKEKLAKIGASLKVEKSTCTPENASQSPPSNSNGHEKPNEAQIGRKKLRGSAHESAQDLFQIRAKMSQESPRERKPGASTSNSDLTSLSSPRESYWTVTVSTEILYARWPYFRRLLDSQLQESIARTALLPFSKDVLLEIVKELCMDGSTTRSNRLGLSESDCMDVLLDGREFELYRELDDFKVGETTVDPTRAQQQGIFGRLIQHCLNSVFSKDVGKNTLLQLQRAHDLQWTSKMDEIAHYIGSNFKAVFADQTNKKRLKELPQELRLLILDSHVHYV